MQAIKGLIALLIVAVLVFGAVAIYNSKSEPEYEAQLKSDMMARTMATEKHFQTSAVAETANGVKTGEVKTHSVARQKIKNVNL